MVVHNVLMEIGTEEIPAKLIDRIHDNLQEVTTEVLNNYRIETGEISVLGAPRRMTVMITGMAGYQNDLVQEIKGPPCNIAFDDEGQPTKAATGFASGQGVAVEDLERRETEKGDYLFAVVEEKGRPVKELLPAVFTDIITSLKFPVSMRWGEGEFEFIRPIHWLLGLCDEQVIDFSVAGIESGRTSRGHRFLANRRIKIDSYNTYLPQLRENYVIVDPRERKKMIVDDIENIEHSTGGQVMVDKGLLREIVHLVEYPTTFCGSFEDGYLDLPEPVLITPIKEHQRYFVVRDKEGELLPRFVAVRDGSEDYIEVVREGNEKVVKARLEDADFYYRKDRETDLDSRVEQLRNLVFIEELGSMYDKIERMVNLVEFFGQKLKLKQEEIKTVRRTAYLAKADLVSHMVREFPELQGIIGAEYARLEGEAPEICRGIKEHYLPRYAGDMLPQSVPGRLVALADKIDTLAGTFGVGMIPTGSEDPHGLRRSAMGVVRIFKDAAIDINLAESLDTAIRGFDFQRPDEQVLLEVHEFIRERIEYLLREDDIEPDIIAAVTAEYSNNIPAIFRLAAFLAGISREEKFAELVTAYTRIKNITGERESDGVKKSLLEEKVEKELYSCYSRVKNDLRQREADVSCADIYGGVLELIQPVHNFFETVMVMAEREAVKENRLNLLTAIKELMSRLGDLSQITVE